MRGEPLYIDTTVRLPRHRTNSPWGALDLDVEIHAEATSESQRDAARALVEQVEAACQEAIEDFDPGEYSDE